MNKSTFLPDEIIINKIYLIRNQKVMIDRDLADMYGVETKRLKEAVRRNMERFPKDFMFEMTNEELNQLRSQFAEKSLGKMGLRHKPFCFTEQGLTMLSCVLNSDRAIQVNIQVIRIFTRLRELVLSNKEILVKLELLEKNVMKNNEDIRMIFSALKQLFREEATPRKTIGYKRSQE